MSSTQGGPDDAGQPHGRGSTSEWRTERAASTAESGWNEIEAGDGPYKASIALSSPVFGYALAYEAADWLEGKSVPQAIDALPIALTKDNLPSYEADQADPGAVFADPERRGRYIKMYGNICYDTRDHYLNFPWSSEGK